MSAVAVDLMHLAVVVAGVMVLVGGCGLFCGLYRLAARQRTEGVRLALHCMGSEA